MVGYRFPDEPTTPQQLRVIAWATIVLFAVVGTVGFCYSFQAPPEKVDAAQQLRIYCLACYGLAAGVYAAKRLVGYFIG